MFFRHCHQTFFNCCTRSIVQNISNKVTDIWSLKQYLSVVLEKRTIDTNAFIKYLSKIREIFLNFYGEVKVRKNNHKTVNFQSQSSHYTDKNAFML